MSERRYGSFRRQLTLPSDVDPNSIKADFNKGVLAVSMKQDKDAQRRSRKIKIG
jgi:HSP20 family protein